ncbi:MAG: hypothetical protein QOJ50_2619 [Cryptosporangiaceae bacterium]|jgi:nitroreductase|nr:hypothetical protein [Cryptosporangiaceae bacterium]
MSSPRLDDATFTAAVAAAVRAPSLHNSQPWRFRRNGDAMEVWADPARQLPTADPGGWAVRIACGAAALNLRLALAVRGHPARMELLPDRGQPHLLIRLSPAPARPASPEETALAAVIERRQSNRSPFADAPVSLPQQAALTSAAHSESADLVIVTGRRATADVADLTRAADSVLRGKPGYTGELLTWTRPDSAATDGVPIAAGGPAPAPHELLARRDFGGAPAAEHRRYEDQPLVAVLSSFGDTPRDQLIAGVALQRVLLTATRIGLAVSMLSQPIEVPGVRAQLQDVLGRISVPQMVLRIGFAVPGPRTPRRPAESVIDDLAAN